MAIICIGLLASIYHKTGENPLEVFDKKYYKPSRNNRLSNSVNKVDYAQTLSSSEYCQCGEKILNNICTEEQIISGCFDVSKNSDRLLRNLVGFNCKDLDSKIESQGGYSKVFDLGFNTVHKMALGILILLIANLVSVALSVLLALGSICFGENVLLLIAPFAVCIVPVVSLSGLVNFILFIILLVNYYKGTTTGEFLDYWNICLNETERQFLKDPYDKLHSLHSVMTAFVVLNFIPLGLSFIGFCLGCCNKEKNQEINNPEVNNQEEEYQVQKDQEQKDEEEKYKDETIQEEMLKKE
jgi:hypothetical protein